MACDRCDQATHVEARRAMTAERDGKVAVVLDVPMQECEARGDRVLDWEVARQVEEMLSNMLAGDAELTTRHFHEQPAA